MITNVLHARVFGVGLTCIFTLGSDALSQESKRPLITLDSSPAPEIIGSFDTSDSLTKRPLFPRAGMKRSGKARTIFQRIAPPLKPPQTKLAAQAPQKETRSPAPLPQAPLPSFDFTIEATWYPNQASLLRIHHQKKVYQFWSNVNWRNLEGIVGLRDRGQKFYFLLFLQNPHPKDISEDTPQETQAELPALPLLAEKGPHFTTTLETDEGGIPASVLDFLEAAHQFYLEREAELVAATEKRRANRARYRARQQEAARKAPQPPEDIVVRFWHGEPKPLPPHLQPKGRKENQ